MDSQPKVTRDEAIDAAKAREREERIAEIREAVRAELKAAGLVK